MSKDLRKKYEQQVVFNIPRFENSMSFSQEIHQVCSHQGKTKDSDINTYRAYWDLEKDIQKSEMSAN